MPESKEAHTRQLEALHSSVFWIMQRIRGELKHLRTVGPVVADCNEHFILGQANLMDIVSNLEAMEKFLVQHYGLSEYGPVYTFTVGIDKEARDAGQTE